ncbi:MAG: diguanylate cyclase [Marivibrio sp.]|uniref:sensor domain-containing diguanylate cyclase n=1 Tax=Marivibrio sp. TaxID=2039719 RepID=UPI0032EB37AA
MTKVKQTAGGGDDDRDDAASGAFDEALALMRRLFAHHPGPAVLFDRAAVGHGLNTAGERLADQLGGDGGVTMMPQLVQLAVKARIAGKGMAREVPMPGGRARLEATVLPQADGTLLMLGRDATLDASIRTALAESRTRFKDLVDLAADFAWETDESGALTFVSAQGALGYPAETLIGRDPSDLLVDPDSAPTPLPFAAAEPARNVELWMRAADAESRCLLVSAAPVRAADGRRTGARGIAIDVTQERRQQTELAQLKTREQLVQYILDALRGEVEPADMLHAAAAALARAASVGACALTILEGEGQMLEAHFGVPPDAAAIDAVSRRLLREAGLAEGSTEDRRWLGVAARHGGEMVGAITLWRDADAGPWSEDDRRLLEAVERHFGIAFRQILDQLQLERLSRTDELTGLMNRRAFFEDMRRSLQRCSRRGESGALLYIDLDNFKPINDTLGHEAGDRLLRQLGERLRGATRGYDLTARLGGDEFAVWLEGADRAIAERRAREMQREIADLAEPPAAGADPLGASVGIAMLEAGRDGAGQPIEQPDVGDLLAAADAAMYGAKRAGKGGVRFADQGASAAEDEG